MQKPIRRATSQKHIAELDGFSAAMMVMAEMAPDRMSVSQMIFFIKAAAADLRGKQPTFSDIKEELGNEIQRTMHATYRVLLPPSRAYKTGLGWLTRTQNPNDNREWFLKLTPQGKLVIKEVLRALGKEID